MHEQVQAVFRDVFEDDELVIARTTTAREIPGWDSLMHITLIVSLEGRFGVRFKSSQVSGLKNVGDLTDVLAELIGSR